MKKYSILFIAVFLIFSLTACKGKASSSKRSLSNNSDSPEYIERTALSAEMDNKNQISYDSLKKFFTLDYTPEYPDSVFNEADNNEVSGKKN